MSDISTLLQEAKPLYFKRKKRRRQIKTVAGVAACMMIGILLAGLPHPMPDSSNNFDAFYAYLYDDTAYDELVGTNDSDNMDYGSFWSDTYGLVQVI